MATGFVAPNVVKVDGIWHVEGRPRENLKVLARYNPSNLPGKTIFVFEIDFPPSGSSPPHRHGGATAIAIPVSGVSVNQMNGDAPQSYGPGQFWYEAPGCHHQMSQNASDSERAKFIAIVIVDDETIGGKDGMELGNVFVLDKEVEMGEKEPSVCQRGSTDSCC